MQQEISAGQNQQLNRMSPEERMTVLASHDFGRWVDSQYPNAESGVRLRMKRAYVAGFFCGMHRTGNALQKPKKFELLDAILIGAALALVVLTTIYSLKGN